MIEIASSPKAPEVVIRRGVPEDAAEIANAHLNSWREAYRGLLPQSYLDQLPLSFRSRMETWRRIAGESDKAIYVAEAPEGIVGFSAFCPPREKSLSDHGEVGAIYLLEKYKGKGIGAYMLSCGLKLMSEWGYQKAYCWVLAGNPTIRFYEIMGAMPIGMEKDDDIGGQRFKELAYGWKSLERFALKGER